ncbi:hypothetical protein BCR33DRAFT_703130, partial [Rhizoclosmatium globosum]
GNPFEAFQIAGRAVPRYQVAGGVFASIFGFYLFSKVKSSFAPRAPILFTSKEEENYVKRYIHHHHEETHKPLFVRETYSGPSGQL